MFPPPLKCFMACPKAKVGKQHNVQCLLGSRRPRPQAPATASRMLSPETALHFIAAGCANHSETIRNGSLRIGVVALDGVFQCVIVKTCHRQDLSSSRLASVGCLLRISASRASRGRCDGSGTGWQTNCCRNNSNGRIVSGRSLMADDTPPTANASAGLCLITPVPAA
jgi:hypothetical protein